MTGEVCDPADVPKYEPSDAMRAAKEAFDEAKAIADDKLEQLYDAMADELRKRPEVTAIALGNYLGRSDGHVRRVVRKRGVEPRVKVEPPRRLPKDSAEADQDRRRGRRPSPEPETGQHHG